MNSITALIIAIIMSALLSKKVMCDPNTDIKAVAGAAQTSDVAPLTVGLSGTLEALPVGLKNSTNPDPAKDDLDTAQFFFSPLLFTALTNPYYGYRNSYYYNPYFYYRYGYNPYYYYPRYYY